jgi:hypothetical protein
MLSVVGSSRVGLHDPSLNEPAHAKYARKHDANDLIAQVTALRKAVCKTVPLTLKHQDMAEPGHFRSKSTRDPSRRDEYRQDPVRRSRNMRGTSGEFRDMRTRDPAYRPTRRTLDA